MATSYVLDTSALAHRFLDSDGSSTFRDWYASRRRTRARFLAPSIVFYELTNILHRIHCPRFGEQMDHAREVVRETTQGIEIEELGWASTWPWCRDLSAYDASFLALAKSHDATLVTYDRKLANVAAEHVPVIGVDGLD